MNRDLSVHVDMRGHPVPCGRLWTRGGARDSASFEYEPSWLQRKDGFALDPELPLRAGQFHTARPLFRAFTDPAPDRWGQAILRRAERARSRREGGAPRTLTAVDFLTLVDDQTRLGALRFKNAGSRADEPFLSASKKPVPPLITLPRLLAATNRIVSGDETDDDLELVLAPGTSLGGARPKASVLGRDQQLMIAKFPRNDDEWPITSWEATALTLAGLAGIRVSSFQLQRVLKRPVLILDRFDRKLGLRVPFMSAMTALPADDNEPHSYLEIVDALRREGSRVTEDLRELWRRMVFNILISNTDDHLRNHGFVRDEASWRLAPAYDLNPTPTDVKPRIHALAIDEAEATSSMEIAFQVAPRFGITARDARSIAREVARAVRTWRTVGARFGLKPKEVDRMQSAFDHKDAELAAA